LGLQSIRGSGRELKAILGFLRQHYGGFWETRRVAESVNVDEGKVVRLIAYAVDKNWVAISGQGHLRIDSRCRLTSEGIDKLDSWTDEDDELII